MCGPGGVNYSAAVSSAAAVGSVTGLGLKCDSTSKLKLLLTTINEAEHNDSVSRSASKVYPHCYLPSSSLGWISLPHAPAVLVSEVHSVPIRRGWLGPIAVMDALKNKQILPFA